MQALIVIDAQNEFSAEGQRPVPNFQEAMAAIFQQVTKARGEQRPIAWVRHYNQPHESPAFVPGSWGAAFYKDPGIAETNTLEKIFTKNVYGAFTGSDIGQWLQQQHVTEVLITGFYTHGCVSTTAREAIMRNLTVYLDPTATGACDLEDEQLGTLTAAEVKRSALLQLVGMGAQLER
jgi:nicotinamidase-related amidase